MQTTMKTLTKTHPSITTYDSLGTSGLQRNVWGCSSMKDLPYFKFNVSEYINGNITLEDYYLQGVFINLCAYYWFKSGKLNLSEIKRRLSDVKDGSFEALASSNLIKIKGEKVSITFLDEQLHERNKMSQINSENGKLGGRPRKATGLFSESESKAKKSNIEEKREEEKRESDKSLPRSLDDRKRDFYTRLTAETNNYSKKMLRAFYDYWTEHNPNGKKLRFEKEKVFDVKKRLATWARREGIEPAEETKSDYSNAEIDRKNLTVKAWEETYSYYLETDNNFRKHFNYDELPESSAVGSHN